MQPRDMYSTWMSNIGREQGVPEDSRWAFQAVYIKTLRFSGHDWGPVDGLWRVSKSCFEGSVCEIGEDRRLQPAETSPG